jgi:methionyl-tRNA formyltransferase
MALRVLFFGTPAFAVPSLTALLASSHQVVGVVTQPDRPRGRGQHVTASAVKQAALAAAIPVLQPDRLKTPDTADAIRLLAPDLAVVAAYGRLLPQALLDLPPMGMINVHASRLPRWRGAAPVHRAVLAGDRTTGVTIMRVVLALDAGPMLASCEIPVGDDETSAELERRLADTGATLLIETVDRLASGPIVETPQDERAVTYAARLERRESQIDWRRPAAAIHNQIRGLQPWPLAAATLNGRRVSLLKSSVETLSTHHHDPGVVVAVARDSFVVGGGDGGIRVLALQEAGRAAMTTAQYLNGRPVREGDRLLPLPEPA